MPSFIQLQKLAKKNKPTHNKYKIVILSDSSSQHIKTALEGMGIYERFPVCVIDTDYNQVEIQIMDKDSILYREHPDAVLLFQCTQKLYETYCGCSDRRHFCDIQFEKYSNWCKKIVSSGIKVLWPLFVEINDNVFGNYGYSVEESFIFQLRKLNMSMMNNALHEPSLYIIDLPGISIKLGYEAFCAPAQYCNSKLSISFEAIACFAASTLQIVKAQSGIIKKCVILDLDNTLWGGVIGDDGINGIEIGELGIGHAFYDFQLWLKELKKRGVLLCVCSKNNEDIAKEPFVKHPEMVLKLDDFAMFVANWNDKASNIRMIQQTLNIGMDSIVFIDDNPFERGVVRNLIPEITVPEMPDDPAEYKDYLTSLNLFEIASYSSQDSDRTKQYQQEAARKHMQESCDSFEEYLKGINMVGECKKFDQFYYPRIAQLSQRSNQFNLRTIRYSESDIQHMAESGEYITLRFTLKDKFGDYGLVSVVILKKMPNQELFVDTWLMSCRVLKRGMEEYVVDSFVNIGKQEGFKKIIGEYIPTPKNEMVRDLYSKYGFTSVSENRYELIIDNFKPFDHHIKEEA